MRKQKIGIIFATTMFIIAGIGISYAGFTDTIQIYGTIQTATVDLEVKGHSVTEIWKIWGDNAPDDEIYKWYGYTNDQNYPLDKDYVLSQTQAEFAERISWTESNQGDQHDVDFKFMNIFPCIDFRADVIIKYTGSIPAKINWPDLIWDENGNNYDFSTYTKLIAYYYDLVDEQWVRKDEISPLDFPLQIHESEYIGFEVEISLVQDNILQNKNGKFSLEINAIQWHDDCSEEITDNDNDGFDVTIDCDDNDNTVYPDAEEILDGKDNNCNGLIDEGLSCPELFFSEYIEGSSYNKALEIYNSGDYSADLSDVSINLFLNGENLPSKTIELDQHLLEPGETYVIAHPSIDESILSECDQLSSLMTYNGDDSIELIWDTSTLDVIGQIGFDPGTNWGTDDFGTKDCTLTRKCPIIHGDINGYDNFDPQDEWNCFEKDDFNYLGTHC